MEVGNNRKDTLADVIELIKGGHNIAFMSAGGCGKSYAVRELIKTVEKDESLKYIKIHCTSTTGKSALNLTDNGNIRVTTLHQWAGGGLLDKGFDKAIASIKKNRKAMKRWRTCRVLVIDEFSMLGKNTFGLLDSIGRSLRMNNKPFGGIQVLLSGDVLQLPPVKDCWIFEYDRFEEFDFQYIKFTTPYRFKDKRFYNLTIRARGGRLIDDDIRLLIECYDKYKKFQKLSENDDNVIKPTVLYSRRVDVERENEIELNKLSTKAYTIACADTIKRKKRYEFENYDNDNGEEYYKVRLTENIQEKIVLKEGAQVVLKYNLDVDEGLVNGSRGIVRTITESVDPGSGKKRHIINVEFVNGKIKNIDPIVYKFSDKYIKARRLQVPLQLAWASTIHSCQGMTLDKVLLDLGDTLFAPGQGYVSISRARDLDSVFIKALNPTKIRADKKALAFCHSINYTLEL